MFEAGTGFIFAIVIDANVAALGVRWLGAGDIDPDVVFVTLGSGVGGGFVAGGILIDGVCGAGGEI
ncbi:ROK family protein, partial [Enterococcus lactis]|nr:ROK family protein [Enterococcus lactis]